MFPIFLIIQLIALKIKTSLFILFLSLLTVSLHNNLVFRQVFAIEFILTKKRKNMKKTFLIIVLIILIPLAMIAESYTSLWKKYQHNIDISHPQTAISVLDKIIVKATAEKKYGEIIEAELEKYRNKIDISNDSLNVVIASLKQKAIKAEKNNKAVSAIYYSVLGTVYQNQFDGNKDSLAVGKEYFHQSLAHPEVLANEQAKNYEPLMIEGSDSRIFYNDLLHVIGIAAKDYKTLYDWYLYHNNRSATCLCAYYMNKRDADDDCTEMSKSACLQKIDSLIDVYQDLEVAGELAIEHFNFMDKATDATVAEKIDYINFALSKWGKWKRMNILRNAYSRLTLPSYLVDLGSLVQIPNTERTVEIRQITNVAAITMTVTKLKTKEALKIDVSNNDGYSKIAKMLMRETGVSVTHRYIGIPNYKVSCDSMKMPKLDKGVYLVEFTTDNKDMRPERMLLHVSDMYALTEGLPDDNLRFVAVSATTGQPIPGAKIKLTEESWSESRKKNKILTTLVADKHGEAMFHYVVGRTQLKLYVYTDQDRFCPETSTNSGYYYYDGKEYGKREDVVDLFTDRSLYRPGQTVNVNAIAYSVEHHKDKTSVNAGKEITLKLRDVNYKVVKELSVTTDEYGSASAKFELPKTGRTGSFSISTEKGSVYFRVEEYKRPTFKVEFYNLNTAYNSGDTVKFVGTAKSYAGVPVQNANVKYTVTRRPNRLWWRFSADDDVVVAKDTIKTDAIGKFEIPVKLALPESKSDIPRYYTYNVNVQVTDLAGETHEAETSIPLSNRNTVFNIDLPQRIERDSLKTITFDYSNIAGDKVDGKVYYKVDGKPYTAKTNVATDITAMNLKSGAHELEAICNGDTIMRNFTVFSMKDKRLAEPTRDWFYVSDMHFRNDDKPIYVQLGTSDDNVYVVYSIIAGDKVIDNGTLEMSANEVYTRAFKYKEEYGDGITVDYAWVKDGKIFQHSANINRALPDMKLNVKWTTFRDRLTPGQKETWMLSVTNEKGKAAKAQLMATMYDVSLDAIHSHDWNFEVRLNRFVAALSWRGTIFENSSLYGEMPIKYLNQYDLDFTHMDDLSMDGSGGGRFSTNTVMIRGTRSVKRVGIVGSVSAYEGKFDRDVTASFNDIALAKSPKLAIGSTTNKKTNNDYVRENLNETAFFYPALQTDKNGNVALSFTLPESVTTWKFMGLAHDKSMNSGMITAEAVAKKNLMIMPNVPRFVRMGDNATIAARVINTTDKKQIAKAYMTIIDPETEKVLLENHVPVTIEPNGSSNVNFKLSPSEIKINDITSPLICRMTIEGKNFSDAEQHYLPILSDKEHVITTIAFSQNVPGTYKLDIDKLFPVKENNNKLTLAYTNNPAWMMIEAMPSVAKSNVKNAMSLAAKYYTNSISAYLLKNIGNTDSLNLLNTYKEDALYAMRQLQNGDGSYSWWPGMHGSLYMTVGVTEMLQRLNVMIGEQNATSSMINQSMKYLSDKVAENVTDLKKLEKQGVKSLLPDETSIRYLYLCALRNSGLDNPNSKYLLKLLEKRDNAFTIYGKAMMSVIFARCGNMELANQYLTSIKEYSVYTDEMGRYFDTRRAGYSWFDYKIPTEVAAIEALKLVSPNDKQTIAEMQRWLLQSKRTQNWDTPINCVNAVYAFLQGETRESITGYGDNTVLKLNGEKLKTTEPTSGRNVVKAEVIGKHFGTLTAEKSSSNISWGAVYAEFDQKVSDIESNSTSLSVKRELVDVTGAVIKDNKNLKVGDKITVRLTIKANRDYDFVDVQDKRAACMEPVDQTSGYGWGYYYAPGDDATNYYFDRLSKGTHVVETEYYIDREGEYMSGTCTARCTYSTEFSGRDKAMKLNIKDEK